MEQPDGNGVGYCSKSVLTAPKWV